MIDRIAGRVSTRRRDRSTPPATAAFPPAANKTALPPPPPPRHGRVPCCGQQTRLPRRSPIHRLQCYPRLGGDRRDRRPRIAMGQEHSARGLHHAITRRLRPHPATGGVVAALGPCLLTH